MRQHRALGDATSAAKSSRNEALSCTPRRKGADAFVAGEAFQQIHLLLLVFPLKLHSTKPKRFSIWTTNCIAKYANTLWKYVSKMV